MPNSILFARIVKGISIILQIPYARSQGHLLELTEKVCDAFDDYAQATVKATGQPTLIRMMTPEGNMNPRFPEVDIAPDDDLNKMLKFHVS